MDPSGGSSSSKKAKRENLGLDAAADRPIKFRNLESVMQSDVLHGRKLDCGDVVEIPVLATSEVISPVKEVPVSVITGAFFPAINRCGFASLAAKGGSCNANEVESSRLAKKTGAGINIFSIDAVKGQKAQAPEAPTPGFDLNATDLPNAAECTQLEPDKRSERVRSPESECESTAGPSEETSPMKMWNDLKQNSFISINYGGIPLPKTRKYHSKKRKEAEHRRNLELAKKEQVSRFAKVAAPTGLLSGLNPGIINHVRNSKQVRAIIHAMVKSVKAEEFQAKHDNEYTENIQVFADHECRDHFVANANNPSMSTVCSESDFVDETSGATVSELSGYDDAYMSSRITSECEDDTLTLRLSSSGVKGSDNAGCITDAEYPASSNIINSLSLRGANVASQWLELLHQDLRGRYAALKRSRKRVRTVIQNEFPNLVYTSNCVKLQCEGESLGTDKNLEAHAARWKAIFTQMERTLNEEAKHLENYLLQVREMQLHCETGLKYFNATDVPFLGASNFPRLKDEIIDKEFAVMAAAASIFSTCEFAVSTENVPCF